MNNNNNVNSSTSSHDHRRTSIEMEELESKLEDEFQKVDSEHIAYDKRELAKASEHQSHVEKTVTTALRSHHIIPDELEVDKENRTATKSEKKLEKYQLKEEADEANATVNMEAYYDNMLPDPMNDYPQTRAYFFRGVIAFLALGLLWTTSFVVCVAIAQTFIPAPTLHQVFESGRKAMKVTNQQHDQYVQCVPIQVGICNDNLNKIMFGYVNSSGGYVEGLAAKQQAILQVNADSANIARTIATYCSAIQFLTVNSFTNWQKGGTNDVVQPLPFYNLSNCVGNCSCTPAEQSAIASVGGVGTASKIQAIQTSNSYSSQIGDIVNQWDKNVTALNDYNEWYVESKIGQVDFIAFNISNIMLSWPAQLNLQVNDAFSVSDQAIACLSMAASFRNKTCPAPNARTIAIATYNQLQNAFNTLTNDFNQNINAIDTYVYLVTQKLNQVQSLFNQLNSYANKIASCCFTLNLFSLSIPQPQIILPILPPVILNVDQQFAALENLVNFYVLNLTNVFDNLDAVQLQWINDINVEIGPLPTIFTDYNPPPVNSPVDEIANVSSAYGEKLTGQISNIDIAPPESVNITMIQAPKVNITASKIQTSYQFNFVFQPLDGNINIDFILYALANALVILQYSDIAYRVYRSYYIIMLYWRRGAVGIPPIDVRDESTIDAPRDNILIRYSKILSNPMFLVLFGSLVFTLVVLALIGIFTPSYNSYLSGCAYSTRGTVLTVNMYSFAFNYASEGGNQESLIQLNEYDVTRAKYCGTYLQNSVQQDAQLQNDIQQSISTQDQTFQTMNMYYSCVNYSDFGFNYAGYQQIYNASNPNEIIDNSGSCYQNISALPFYYTIFDCTSLPVCAITCHGVNEEVLYKAMWQSSCYIEWAIFAHVLRGISMVIVYLALNASRFTFVWGISHLNWRSLTIGGFSYTGTVSQMGNTNSHKRLAKPISQAVKKYERDGWLYIGITFALQLPYIIWLSFVHNNMTIHNQ